MDEHRLYIVLGILLLLISAKTIARADYFSAVSCFLAGVGIITNGANALRKQVADSGTSRKGQFQRALLMLAVLLAIALLSFW